MAKNTVTLRKRKLKGGKFSLYLDYYREGKREYEFLKDLEYLDGGMGDAHKLEVAEFIRKGRYEEITGKRAPVLYQTFEQFIAEAKPPENHHAQVVFRCWLKCHTVTPFHRLHDAVLVFMRSNSTKAPRTQRNYITFVSVWMKEAGKAGLLDANTVAGITRSISEGLPKIPRRQLPKYLTKEEYSELYNTEPDKKDSQICKAFLFACMTGLRISDVFQLKPANIDRINHIMTIRQQKTGQDIVIPLNEDALTLSENPYSLDKVFHLPERKKTPDRLLYHDVANKALSRWAKRAGITKHITFHVARHTFATFLINDGVDIYVIQKLLGHASVKETEIYLELRMQTKHDAVSRLTNFATPDTAEKKKARELRALEEQQKEIAAKIERLKQH
jgi:integrase